jgi:NADH-quinone oxidoreductase subunit C
MASKLLELMRSEFPDEVLDTHSRLGNETVVLRREKLVEIVGFLRSDSRTQMNLLRDITAVDYLQRRPRFEVVYVFYSLDLKHMLVLRVPLEGEDISIPSIHAHYGCAGWLEREVYDMYGMNFEGHPDLRRVLLYDEFEGHPLRKDYAVQHSQPRVALRMRERDSVEEFLEYHKQVPTAGSRPGRTHE